MGRSKRRERWECGLPQPACRSQVANHLKLAVVKSHSRERHGKGTHEVSGKDQEDERE